MNEKGTAYTKLVETAFRKQRIKNSRLMSRIRLAMVTIFFLIHLYMGFVVGAVPFRGKETLFLVYLCVGLLFTVLSKGQERFAQLNGYAVALFDIPIILLLVDSWLPALGNDATRVSLGLLGFAFMLVLVVQTALYFDGRIIAATTAMANLALFSMFARTGVHQHTVIVGFALLNFAAILIYLVSIEFRHLLLQTIGEQSRNEKLARYFAPSVVDAIVSDGFITPGSNGEFDITVLFADLRNFTKMSSTMSSAGIVAMLNEVHEILVDCIFKSGGTLDKYLGDGLMAYFGAPIQVENHADKALECALSMRTRIQELNLVRVQRGEEAIQLGIGIHSGLAIVGDIGAPTRREFTAIGDTVNVASRVESLTKKYEVDTVLTEETRARLKGAFSLSGLGEETVRGKSHSIHLHTLQKD